MSLTTAVTIRQVKEVYVVAQWMKIGLASLTIDNYAKRLSDIRSKVERLSASSLDHAVVYENGVRRHHDRLKRLEESSFQVRVVSLDSCSVWKEMGERKWASGLVSTVAKRFFIHGEVGDPLHVMMNFASQGHFEALPIIVYSRNSNPDQFRIDDGNHRAVANYLVGKIEALAFIGNIKCGPTLSWEWP